MGIPSIETHQSFAALTGTMMAFSIIAVVLRFYSRRLQKAELKADDWIMIPCLVYPKVLIASKPFLAKTVIAGDFLSLAAYGFIKISALLFYIRIFCVQGRTIFQAILYSSIVVVFLWMLAFMILATEQCGSHFSALWGSTAEHLKYCNAKYPFLLIASATDAGLDLWVICLPIPMIWTLKMNIARKLSVMGVFLLAIMYVSHCPVLKTCYSTIRNRSLAASLIKLGYIADIQIRSQNIRYQSWNANRHLDGLREKDDPQLINTRIGFFIILEAGLSCIAVNLPTLYFLTGKVSPEHVLRSVRSMLSLRSIRSEAGSQRSHTYSAKGSPGSAPNSSLSHLAPTNGVHIETHTMNDLESRGKYDMHDDVNVTKTISQVSERA
ncbi:plasma membrane Pth11 protein [Rutstroemia sp. NJR-2017a BBW]|nr:plasma membrane Pth11 protein [Rutstroemia sp. NJR-2017a BBW]